MYAITATVTRTVDGWTSTRQIPTFYLHENVQGIVSELHAAKLAKDIIDPFEQYDFTDITAVKVQDESASLIDALMATKAGRRALEEAEYALEETDEDDDFCARCMRVESECRCYVLDAIVPEDES